MRIGVYPQVFEDRELGEREGREVGSSQWVKKSGPPFEESGREFDYHWYEHPEVGRVEVKRKEIA